MKEIRFGKTYLYEGTIPCIEVIVDNGEKIQKRYLSAFRDYCFQVSGTWNGEHDMGSTPIFGLDTFGSIEQRGISNINQKSTVKYFIAAVAAMAINQFAYRLPSWDKDIYEFEHRNEDNEPYVEAYRISIPDMASKEYAHIFYKKEQGQWNTFLDMCVDRYYHHYTHADLVNIYSNFVINSKEDIENLPEEIDISKVKIA